MSQCEAKVVEVSGDEVWVEDLESANGTYVNQHRIDQPVSLNSGDEVQVGKFRLVFFIVTT